jgi:hypothetical protein
MDKYLKTVDYGTDDKALFVLLANLLFHFTVLTGKQYENPLLLQFTVLTGKQSKN